MRYTFIFLLVFALLLSACEEDAQGIEIPKVKPMLVVGSFISPQDKEIQVIVSRSAAVLGTQPDPSQRLVTNASVVMSSGSNSISLPYNSDRGLYVVPAALFKIEAGKTYFLEVSTPEGDKVSASCSVPAGRLADFTLDFSVRSLQGYQRKLTMKGGSWQDIAGQANYYRCLNSLVFIYQNAGRIDSARQLVGSFLVHDQGRDGKKISIFENNDTNFQDYGTNDLRGVGVEGNMLVIDYHYYRYEQSRNTYSSGDTPFAEPSLLYSNIKGGLGVFAAYQKTLKFFPF